MNDTNKVWALGGKSLQTATKEFIHGNYQDWVKGKMLKLKLLFTRYKGTIYATTISIFVLFLFCLLFFTLNFKASLDAVELKLFDFRTRLYASLHSPKADPSLALLVYDDDSQILCDEYPQINVKRWPPPRDTWADALKFLRRAPNNVTGVDITFSSIDTKETDNKFIKEIKKSNNVVLAYKMREDLYPYYRHVKPGLFIFNLEKHKSFQNALKAKYEELKINKSILLQVFDHIIEMRNKEQALQKKGRSNNESISAFISKFIKIDIQQFESLPIETIAYSTFFTPQGTAPVYVNAGRDIGIVNVQNSEDISEVVRDNKPIYRYQNTDKFGQSLALALARLALGNPEAKKIGLENGFLTNYLTLGDKKFALNKFGNIYMNWRGDAKTITMVPVVKALIYEKFETLDLQTGYYITPEEETQHFNSHFTNIILNPIEDVYYHLVNTKYNTYFNKRYALIAGEMALDSMNKRNQSYNEKALENYSTYYSKLLYDKLREQTSPSTRSASYSKHLIQLISSDESSKLFNYLNSQEYAYDYYNYIKPNYFHSYYNQEVNPKIKGIPVGYIFSKEYNDYNQMLSEIQTEDVNVLAELDTFYNLIVRPSDFTNKIVLIGESLSGGDIHTTPLAYAFPGPEIVATATDNFLNDGTKENKLISKVPLIIDILVIILLVNFTYFSIMKSSNYFSSVVILLFTINVFIFFNISVFILPSIRLWFNMTYPMILIILTAICTVMYKNIIIDKDKKEIKNLFGKFVSPQILDAVINDPKMVSIDQAKVKDMTVLFTDVRNFTTLSETLPPEKLIPQLNEMLNEMVEVIVMKYNGTLDKFMGDAIMAFWGDPVPMKDHARQSVLAALSMLEHLNKLNEVWEKEGKVPIKIGIGLNSGDMIVGHMGSERLVDYTVLGDNVNIASRLEGLNKQFGTEIIVSESTYRQVEDIVEAIDLGNVKVKGKASEIKIYSILKLKDGANVDFEYNPKLLTKKDVK